MSQIFFLNQTISPLLLLTGETLDSQTSLLCSEDAPLRVPDRKGPTT